MYERLVFSQVLVDGLVEMQMSRLQVWGNVEMRVCLCLYLNICDALAAMQIPMQYDWLARVRLLIFGCGKQTNSLAGEVGVWHWRRRCAACQHEQHLDFISDHLNSIILIFNLELGLSISHHLSSHKNKLKDTLNLLMITLHTKQVANKASSTSAIAFSIIKQIN